MIKSIVLLCLLIGLWATTADAQEMPKRTQSMRAVIQRSLPFIEERGNAWIKQRDCLSCHHVSFMVWSLNRADELGFEVDDNRLQDWNNWSTTWTNLANPKRRDEAEQITTIRKENDTVAQLLLGRPKTKKGTLDPRWLGSYRSHLAESQRDDGSWKPGGQLPSQKRSLRETQEVSTMWAMVALSSFGQQNDAMRLRMAKGSDWLGDQTRGQSTEWWSVRLLLDRAGRDATRTDRTRSELLRLQRHDGGWGWLCQDESDALATGVAIYALSRDGHANSQLAIAKALEFLSRTQNDDGSWSVRGTKKNAANRVVETATYWGTCWAVIGMLQSIEKERPQEESRIKHKPTPIGARTCSPRRYSVYTARTRTTAGRSQVLAQH